MMTKADLHRYYGEGDLVPVKDPTLTPSDYISDNKALDDFLSFIEKLHQRTYITTERKSLSSEFLIYLDFFRTFGCFDIKSDGENITVTSYTTFSLNFIKSFLEQQKKGLNLIDDWRSKNIYQDRLTGFQMLFYSEINRIDKSVKSGQEPRVFRNVNVAYAIIKIKDPGKEDRYLFECNKDWQMINFFGGKQENIDKGKFENTILRELEEELEIPRKTIRVKQLYDQVSSSYSLTGAAGTLTRYSGMLYQAFLSTPPQTKNKDKLLTLAEIKNRKTNEGDEFMIASNHYDNMMKINLEELPYSYELPVSQSKEIDSTSKKWIIKNKDIISSIIALFASILGIYKCQ